MIGIPGRSTATRFCKSRPLSPGRATSRTRQFGTNTGGLARKSCAETNVSTHQPAFRRSASSDSRIELAGSQCFFGLSLVLHVGQESVPALDLSLQVSERNATSLKPSKHAVKATAAVFEVKGFARLSGIAGLGDHGRKVVWMDHTD